MRDTSKPRYPRLVSRNDGLHVVHRGRRHPRLGDLYVRLLAASWRRIITIMTLIYLGLNTLFALGYLALGGALANARPGAFLDAFFFSVQTFATIGYGAMTPQGIAANLLVTVESLFSFAFYGVVTGLVFSKFSRPTARIMFSDRAVITLHNGEPHFMLRLANERDNRIADATAKLTLMRNELTLEGTRMRRFYTLPLVRREIPVLRLTWTVMHRIDAHSPLYGITAEMLAEMEAEIIISIKGIDETLSQTIHARHSYIAPEIVCGGAFEDILHRRDHGVLEVHYDRFHAITS